MENQTHYFYDEDGRPTTPYQVYFYYNDGRQPVMVEASNLRNALAKAMSSIDFQNNIDKQWNGTSIEPNFKQELYYRNLIQEIMSAEQVDQECRANKTPLLYKMNMPNSIQIEIYREND
jgi:hypothetical protein